MSHELSAKAILLLHENGQVLSRSGWMEDEEVPVMAALVSALTATSRSLRQLGDQEVSEESPLRIHCESDATGLYVLSLGGPYWLSTLYDQPLNPGLFRMKVRRYAETIRKLAHSLPEDMPIPESVVSTGVSLTPGSDNSALFENITDEEIDNLFAGSEQ